MVKIAVCDDEQRNREDVVSLINEYAEVNGDTSIVQSPFFSGEQLICAIAELGGFDIYLLDVVMPAMNGIDLGLAIRKYDTDGKIIYLTKTPEFAVDSYRLGAFFYLLKPIEKEAFFDVLGRAVESVHERKDKYVMIKSKERQIKVSYDSILCVELSRRSIIYHLTDGSRIKSVTIRVSFSEAVAQIMLDERFFMCGASLLVNLYHLTSVDSDSVTFAKCDEKSIYIPKNCAAQLRTAWLDFWFKNGGNK